ncbi:hypothetical protein O3P69_020289 [Scylla paramamosain]|uniref:Uncharacterized protein n=1 Tax=Scylla paramamosain TaxID=85552 RepID=A0AAW0SF96_SCYPA
MCSGYINRSLIFVISPQTELSALTTEYWRLCSALPAGTSGDRQGIGCSYAVVAEAGFAVLGLRPFGFLLDTVPRQHICITRRQSLRAEDGIVYPSVNSSW